MAVIKDYSLFLEGVESMNTKFGLKYDAPELERAVELGHLMYFQHSTSPMFLLVQDMRSYSGEHNYHILIGYNRENNSNVREEMYRAVLDLAVSQGADGISFISEREGWKRVFPNAKQSTLFEIEG